MDGWIYFIKYIRLNKGNTDYLENVQNHNVQVRNFIHVGGCLNYPLAPPGAFKSSFT